MRLRILLVLTFLLSGMGLAVAVSPTFAQTPSPAGSGTILISRTVNGIQGTNTSDSPAVSADGRYTVFASAANNLVNNDNNGKTDIFVYDRVANQIKLISVRDNGTQGNGDSLAPVISADGRYIAYWSFSSTLVGDDNNGQDDIFLYDREDEETDLISRPYNTTACAASSFERPAISDNGRYIAFRSDCLTLVPGDSNFNSDVFVYDRVDNVMERVSVTNAGVEGNNYSYAPSISADGRFVAFLSIATNLVPNDTNGKRDVFVYDRRDNLIERVSLSAGGGQSNVDVERPAISATGRYVAFDAPDGNLEGNDDNEARDVFVYDRQDDNIDIVSVANDGTLGNGDSTAAAFSYDGQFVAFVSTATNFGDDSYDIIDAPPTPSRPTARLNTDSITVGWPNYVTALGRSGWASDDEDDLQRVYIHDRDDDLTTLISAALGGNTPDGNSYAPAVTADGRFVAFSSDASNLVQNDNNGYRDVFLRDRDTPGIFLNHEIVGQGTLVNVRVQGFRPNATLSITINDRFLGNMQSDGNGNTIFALNTNNASVGDYNVYVTDATIFDTAYLRVASGAPVYPPSTAPIVFTVPSAIAAGGVYLYLPQVLR